MSLTHSKDRLIFVYNADEGAFNVLMDMAHKVFAPKTYQCKLCALTHGVTSMRSEWRSYIAKINYETRFYHRDGFRQEWPLLDVVLPAILIQKGDASPKILLDTDLLNEQQSLAQLMAVMGRKLIERRYEASS